MNGPAISNPLQERYYLARLSRGRCGYCGAPRTLWDLYGNTLCPREPSASAHVAFLYPGEPHAWDTLDEYPSPAPWNLDVLAYAIAQREWFTVEPLDGPDSAWDLDGEPWVDEVTFALHALEGTRMYAAHLTTQAFRQLGAAYAVAARSALSPVAQFATAVGDTVLAPFVLGLDRGIRALNHRLLERQNKPMDRG